MYKQNEMTKSALKSVEKLEGEPIETKIERIVNNKEPIRDGAPEIFTERRDGVIAGYNIRTDRWEVATDAHIAIERAKVAKREERARLSMEVVRDEPTTGDVGAVGGA